MFLSTKIPHTSKFSLLFYQHMRNSLFFFV